jgi:hypothetical protein
MRRKRAGKKLFLNRTGPVHGMRSIYIFRRVVKEFREPSFFRPVVTVNGGCIA